MESGNEKSPPSTDDKPLKIYSWNWNSKRARAIESELSQSISHVEFVNLLERPETLVLLDSECEGNLKFPCLGSGSVVYGFSSEMVATLATDNGEGKNYSFPDISLDPKWEYTTPTVGFLDREWNWPEIMLNMVETLGCSVEKTGSDPFLPEEFIIDCFKRNLNIQTVKDARILIFELLNNGFLEEVRQEAYKLTYHLNPYCLNSARQEFEEDVKIPKLVILIPHLIRLLSRVRKFHSLEFLSFVDHTTFFHSLHFADLLSQPSDEAVKNLVDLHCILTNHIDISGEYLESSRSKYFYTFKDQKVTLNTVRKEIFRRTSSAQKEGMEALLWSRWTISGNPSTDSEILRVALKVFANEVVYEDEKGVTWVPSFLKAFKAPRKKKTYEIHINPCLTSM